MRLLLVLSVNPVMLMIATMGPMKVRQPNAKVLWSWPRKIVNVDQNAVQIRDGGDRSKTVLDGGHFGKARL